MPLSDQDLLRDFNNGFETLEEKLEFYKNNPEICETLIKHVQSMEHTIRNVATKDDIKEFEERIDRHSEEMREHSNARVNHERRISSLESQIDMMKTHNAQMKLSVDTGVEISKQIFEAVQISRDSKPKVSEPKSKVAASIAAIPVYGWAAIVIISIAIISAMTGHLGEFFDWVSSYKLFGGVK